MEKMQVGTQVLLVRLACRGTPCVPQRSKALPLSTRLLVKTIPETTGSTSNPLLRILKYPTAVPRTCEQHALSFSITLSRNDCCHNVPFEHAAGYRITCRTHNLTNVELRYIVLCMASPQRPTSLLQVVELLVRRNLVWPYTVGLSIRLMGLASACR